MVTTFARPANSKFEHAHTHSAETSLRDAVLNKLYPPLAPVSIWHLTLEDTALYTNILSHHPDLSLPMNSHEHAWYYKRTAAIIATLPPRLLNPIKAPLSRLPQSYLVSLFQTNDLQGVVPPSSRLCSLHHSLNAQIIASALAAIETEVDEYLPDLLDAVDPKALSSITPDLASALSGTEDFCASFMSHDEFFHRYRRAPLAVWTETGIPRAEKHCDACTLARASTNTELLVGLRASMLARLPMNEDRDESQTTPLDLVQGWIHARGDEGTEMLFLSGRLGEELRRLVAASTRGKAETEWEGASDLYLAEGEVV